jgi:hypothetical protein
MGKYFTTTGTPDTGLEALLQTSKSHFAPNNSIYGLRQAKRLNT